MEKYQTFFPRFFALLIDTFIIAPPLFVFDEWFRGWQFPVSFFYFWIAFSSAVSPVYSIWMNAKFGQTLGKMAMRVKILDVSEKPISLRQAVLRESWQILMNASSAIIAIAALSLGEESDRIKNSVTIFSLVVTFWTAAEIIVFLRSEKRRALHDLIAGTVVVKTES